MARRPAALVRPVLLFALMMGAPGVTFHLAHASTLDDTTVVRPFARFETDPVPHIKDAADTPDIWVHPTDPARSLVIATDKRGALMVYDLKGKQLQAASAYSQPNDVSVLYGFRFGGGLVDVAVAACRAPNGLGVKVWLIDPVTDTLTDITEGRVIPVFGGGTPYGSCVYRSPRDARCYFFVTTKQGNVEQYLMKETPDGRVTGERVRAFKLSSISEGCVTDNELGYYYLSEERVGIWKFGAEPDAGSNGKLIARAGEHALTPDVEGLTMYFATGGRGYLIASSQGSSTFNVYDRQGDNPYVLTIDPQAGKIGDVEHTDGIAVTNRPTSVDFPQGFFVAQDGNNKPLNQNFKYYAWEDIAGSRLIIDTHWSPRAAEGSPPLAARDPVEHPGPSNEPLLETESAHLAPPGALTLSVGLEREVAEHRSQSNVPFALEYSVNRRLGLTLEPVVYSKLRVGEHTILSGTGDVELGAIVLPLPKPIAGTTVAVDADVKVPSAGNDLVHGREADVTMALVLSRKDAKFDTHVNLGYTIVGAPPGLGTDNVLSFGVATIRAFSKFDLVGEVYGHSPALADGSVTGAEAVILSDLAGEQLVGTLGLRYRIGDHSAISLGLSYDNTHAFSAQPGFTFRLR
jgi:3-phytase